MGKERVDQSRNWSAQQFLMSLVPHCWRDKKKSGSSSELCLGWAGNVEELRRRWEQPALWQLNPNEGKAEEQQYVLW